MRNSKLYLIASLAGATAWQLYAQPASPELQRKALELLRQTVAQQEAAKAAQSARAKPAPVPPHAPSTTVQPGTNVSRRAPAAEKEEALRVLRQKTEPQSRPGSGPSTRVISPRAAANAPTQPRARETAPAAREGQPQIAKPQGPGTSATPQPSAGPMTKQERLNELLERYQADEITPAQYHAERARILAQP